ncbi:MAG: 1-(5-phosphoribosyl)-5-[(5-phosphoribosylamino)methylideneamino]imidazole-4-carboxamide isomerase [Cyclobacteriaceae bacterium]|nr:1-(5-phosphoribosyl)-5-[(5-phosphoribosylamino)methylideneamino]imidazole-4-carboxamide isomerase [Cyclobacteriaceae bacterium]
MRIIPAIDIINGKCVRLSQGDYLQKKVYNENPVEQAKLFEDAGLSYLHFVDLDGAKNRTITNWKTLNDICSATKLQVDFGGGITTKSDIRKLLDAGVAQINLGSIAVKEPEKVNLWLEEFGADKIILSADVRNEVIAVHGWADSSGISLQEFLSNYQRIGIQFITCTDIHTDGMLSGPNFSLYKKIKTEFPTLKLNASGGVRSTADIRNLKTLGVEGVIIGKAFYEGHIKLEDLYHLTK